VPIDRNYMERALALAERARGRTSPNPMVGCVVVKNNRIIGEGFHARAGEPHAEVVALKEAGDVADATVYITLEPCSHEGRTPPCVNLLTERRPARVIIAMQDPNPLVSGRGIQSLREAGIDIEVGLLENSARQLNEAFIKYISTGQPLVIAKCGMSLDGKIATRSGDSRWITGEESRYRVHQMRDQVDAILVGSRTIMLDDPSLTTRLPQRENRNPVRVLLDSGESLESDRKVFRTPAGAPTWVAATEDRDYPQADEVLKIHCGPGGVDMVCLMQELGRREITSVLIEGGGTTLASAFEAGVVDKVMFFIAPKIIGGRSAVSAVEGMGAERMKHVLKLRDMTATPVGQDVLIEAYVDKES
jgi:diaminohydroxyphosphoribosylaminopyrimidine deaminase / 5-amino-6-(5-phosphoribosylamino)uracil reductase